ncbi:MAG: 3-deoxy-manno-octulosonate cytidylyltransferase [Caulobacterales bacterium 32-69-10]|nr:MAG: 3-deoxy-manno-octulosonate cytidylyltransferase [Caulobacterales bacterium 32-69-10]
MEPIVIIPARMGASRLPGKPLADIGGVPMIVRVARQALRAGVGPVLVAAGEPEIAEACRAAGVDSILTDPDLPSGSDRIMAALKTVDPTGRHDAVINLQGDIPFIAPSTIQSCEHLLRGESSCDIATVAAPEASPADRTNPDVVKAIVAMTPGRPGGRALYFTRSTLYGDGPILKHVGIYGFRRAALERFTAAPPSALEMREKLEQLRAMELGLSIWAAVVEHTPLSVDSPADLEAARAAAKDHL